MTFDQDESIWTLENAKVVAFSAGGEFWVLTSGATSGNAVLKSIRMPTAEVLDYVDSNWSGKKHGHTKFAKGKVNSGVGFVPRPPLPTTQKGIFNRYVTNVLADDEQVVQQLKWLPGAKQPTLGERWGVAVVVENTRQEHVAKTMDEFVELTGEVGVAFKKTIEERLENGDFGEISDSRFASILDLAFVAGTTPEEIAKNIRSQALDNVAFFKINMITDNRNKIVDGALQIHFIETQGRHEPWTSKRITNKNLAAAKERGRDRAKQFVDVAMETIDSVYKLVDMPRISSTVAQSRVAKLSSSTSKITPRVLAEIRYYQVKELIDEKTAIAFYVKTFGAEVGTTFLEQPIFKRRTIIRRWMATMN